MALMVKSRRDQIVFDAADEVHRLGVPAVGVAAFAAEGRHLHGVAVHQHRDRAEFDARGHRAREEPLHLLGRRVGGHVPVFGSAAQERVVDAPAYGVGLVAGVFEHGADGCNVTGNGQWLHGRGRKPAPGARAPRLTGRPPSPSAAFGAAPWPRRRW